MFYHNLIDSSLTKKKFCMNIAKSIAKVLFEHFYRDSCLGIPIKHCNLSFLASDWPTAGPAQGKSDPGQACVEGMC